MFVNNPWCYEFFPNNIAIQIHMKMKYNYIYVDCSTNNKPIVFQTNYFLLLNSIVLNWYTSIDKFIVQLVLWRKQFEIIKISWEQRLSTENFE